MKFLLLAIGLGTAFSSARLLAAKEEFKEQKAAPIISTEMNGSDLGFLSEVARRSAFLIRLSTLAQAHAVTPEVKELAADVARDETGTLGQVKELDSRKRVTFAGEPDGAGRKLLQHFAQLKGAKFDKDYLDALSDAQQQLETAFEQAAGSSDPDIKAFAGAALPGLKKQAARVRELAGD